MSCTVKDASVRRDSDAIAANRGPCIMPSRENDQAVLDRLCASKAERGSMAALAIAYISGACKNMRAATDHAGLDKFYGKKCWIWRMDAEESAFRSGMLHMAKVAKAQDVLDRS